MSQPRQPPGRTAELDRAPTTTSSPTGALDGKVAVITGADSSIGRAVAIAYAREGADLVLCHLDEHDDAEQTADRGAQRREHGERRTVDRMVGAPPGYVGYGESGQLTEAVRRRPCSVLLLDEIEKAHPDVFNVLLQVLDDGRLTDGQGRTVDFRNTVVIMTSNVGSELVAGQGATLGFGSARDRDTDGPLRDKIMPRLRETFRPEFLNRIDEIIVFRRLDPVQLATIARLLLEETRRRLAARGLTVEFTDAAVTRIAELGHQPEFGARPLRRTIQREVDNRLSTLLLGGELPAGAHVRVDAVDGELDVQVAAAAGR